jgi:16S rRNA (guanine527-N7)-methyltransferase
VITPEDLPAVELPPAAQGRLNDFADLFRKWNRRINLSGARSEHELDEHIVDCLHLVPHLLAIAERHLSPRFLDVGSGGGLPAAVVAICMPDAHITALEPVHKKHAFLRTIARQLGLANFEPRAERLEDHGGRDYAAAMSRATLDLREWLLLGVGRVEPGGIAFGFEAVPRNDLPPGTHRHPYTHFGKSRAIVALQRLP